MRIISPLNLNDGNNDDDLIIEHYVAAKYGQSSVPLKKEVTEDKGMADLMITYDHARY